MSDRYKKNAGCVFNIKYHLVWCPKYRRAVLTKDIACRLKDILASKALRLGISLEAVEVMPDHVHVFITGQPTEAIQHIVCQLKGESSHILRSEFAALRSKMPCLWSRSYYCGTVGHVSEASIRKYIEDQKGK